MAWTIGRDVMFTPIETLNALQNEVLFRLADGEPLHQLRESLDLTLAEQTRVEMEIRQRMDARSTAHAVSIAWRQGWIRAICLVLCITSIHQVEDARRLRMPARGGRPGTVQVRLRSGAGGREIDA